MNGNSILQAALGYAEQGLRVFPCHPKTKRPLCLHGCKDATTDPGIISQSWSHWPKAMIGCATGAGNAALVVDVDAGTDPDTGEVFEASAILAQLEAALGEKPSPTRTARTPRGGLHLYFQLPTGVHCGNRSHLIPRVDIRGEGGYVILPPSRRSDGESYVWVNDGPSALAPAALVDAVLRRATWAHASPERTDWPGKGELSDADVEAALERECVRVADAARGTRNETLNRAAFRLGQLATAGALSEQQVRSKLEQAAATNGLLAEDGLRSVIATINSGLKAGAKSPPRRVLKLRRARAGARSLRTFGPLADDEALDRELALLDLTDRGNAERFVRRHRWAFRRLGDGGWLRWDGMRWTREGADAAVLKAVHATVDALKLEARVISNPDDDERR